MISPSTSAAPRIIQASASCCRTILPAPEPMARRTPISERRILSLSQLKEAAAMSTLTTRNTHRAFHLNVPVTTYRPISSSIGVTEATRQLP